MGKFTQERLEKYIPIRREVQSLLEQIAEMKNDELIPAQKESDGSQHTAGASDRMANAVIRRLNFEDENKEYIEDKLEELEAIRNAIYSLPDPMERDVLRFRYMTGKLYRLPKWRDVAIKIYGDDGESAMRNVFKLHKRALESILKISE